jgi:hypothetical protein
VTPPGLPLPFGGRHNDPARIDIGRLDHAAAKAALTAEDYVRLH